MKFGDEGDPQARKSTSTGSQAPPRDGEEEESQGSAALGLFLIVGAIGGVAYWLLGKFEECTVRCIAICSLLSHRITHCPLSLQLQLVRPIRVCGKAPNHL